MPSRVVHFEVEAKDLERAKKFYAEAFGWQMNQMGGDDYGDYVMMTSGGPGDLGINGGLFKFNPQYGTQKMNAFNCVIGVDDIQKAMDDVKKAGGTVLSGPDNIPGVGTYAKCQDTEENYFALLQPSNDMDEKVKPENQPSSESLDNNSHDKSTENKSAISSLDDEPSDEELRALEEEAADDRD